ncbi:N-acyl-D-amino-acid deacylase family protein [Actinoalloteichus caeruleus]|uniref:Dihydroorotase n=2 Tax=Actinoalloteichus cyanogriseus TaxID=2893586 RepID=A0ABT1JD25_ACTCY|nr:D-aminoacylase [Actinoalloteichus caeruleus]MCP2330385.1 dihydroorotase (EC 3.5.2.3) [Actinoalloteichus caeruleus DSM 43889]
MELAIRGALVLDGTGAPGTRADVLVRDGRIVDIGPPGRLTACRQLDVDGLVLAPGFIDMHSHSDLRVLAEPDHLAKVSQGVTLEVLGQDGLSYAPVDAEALDALRVQLAGWNGDPAGFAWTWRSVGEYLDRLDRGVATNVAYLVPQGTLRMLCVGHDDRPASPAEIHDMRRLLDTALSEGAVGMSSGLTYPPGMFASTDELVALCEVVTGHGGYYAPHHRGYGAGALEAYAEVVDIGARAGCAVHLTHATMNFEVNRGRAGELLALVDRALASGLDVSLDTYPYRAGSTSLHALLPSWAAAGGVHAIPHLLRDVERRAAVLHALEVEGSDGCHGVPVDWDTIEINGVADTAAHGHLVGHTVAASARGLGRPAGELYLDVLLADRLGTTCLMHVGHEDNVREIMRHPRHTVGSDGILVGARPHPRAWGTFPRLLGRYVREWGVLGLAECVARMTGRAADRIGLRDRGRIRRGNAADLVLFDPRTVLDAATFAQPRTPAVGIPWVLVNGVPVIADGRRTDALPGRALRREGALVVARGGS